VTIAARRARIPAVIPAAIAAAWLLALLAQASGRGRALHHDALLEGGPPLWVALALFIVAWQAMVAAMMLPTVIPLLRYFAVASLTQPRPRAAIGAFIGGYALVWTVFGIGGFLGDDALHHIVDRTPWLGARPWLVSGGILAVAGAFQFSALKDMCLRKCRLPGLYLLQNYRRGVGGAFRLGRGHGLFCLGCCWALMLVMFAAGVANLWWMAALTAVMVYEKTGRSGDQAVPVVGVALLSWAVLVLAHPAWLPTAFAGVD
jgi:predicted metal-binding membrane protein